MSWFNKIVIGIIVALAVYIAVLKHQVGNLSDKLVQQDSVITLKTGSLAVLAKDRVNSDSLKTALADAKALNGRLLAAANIHLKPDTVLRDSVRTVTVTSPTDSTTRVAEIHDTTKVGILNATIRAPARGDLGFNYGFIPAPINLTASVIGVSNNNVVIAIHYTGGETSVSTPYTAIPRPIKHFTPAIGLVRDFTNQVYEGELRARLITGILGTEFEATLIQPFGTIDANRIKPESSPRMTAGLFVTF